MKLRVFAGLLMSGVMTVAQAAPAEAPAVTVSEGMTCTVADGWWSLDPERPSQPEPVKVVMLKALTTGEPGVWVQPTRGKLTDQQLHIALRRLSDCR